MNKAGSPVPDAATLAALIGRVAHAQDKQAYAALFKHFAPKVKAYLRRSGLGTDSADEVTQEVMLLLWRKASSFDAQRAMASTWIFAIARNARIDHARRSQTLPAAPDPDPEPDPTAETMLMHTENTARLRDALADLSAEQKQIIQLFFLTDTPHSAIATTLNLPLGTVKSRIRLAMNRLRQLLQKDLI